MARNPFGNSFAMNPYRLTGLPSLNTLDKKYSGDLTKLTKPQFEQMTRDKQNTNIRQAFSMFSQFPPSEDTTMKCQIPLPLRHHRLGQCRVCHLSRYATRSTPTR